MARVVENVVYQHAENATFQWLLRENAVNAPHYKFKDLKHLDDRVEGNIDGLRIAGDFALELLQDFRAQDYTGAFFASALLALEQRKEELLESLYVVAENDDAIQREVESALAWVNSKYLNQQVQQLLAAEHPIRRAMGLKACLAHGRNPSAYLEAALTQKNISLLNTALYCAGNLAIEGVKHHFVTLKNHPDESVCFHTTRAQWLMGEKSAQNTLQSVVLKGGEHSEEALALLMLKAERPLCQSTLKALDVDPKRARDVVRGFGLLGDAVAIPWLLSKAEDPKLARLCGESISMITGVDLAYQDLENVDMDDPTAGPNDNPNDANVDMDPDENLPWPHLERLQHWWPKQSSNYPVGQSFVAGQPRQAETLQRVIQQGFQRQRNVAALCLGLSAPQALLKDTRAPSHQQVRVI